MLRGLVAVGVLPHVRQLHLAHFVVHSAPVAFAYLGPPCKHVVKSRRERIASAHRLHESRYVMHDAPRPVQRIPFDEIAVAPLDRIEVVAEPSVAQPSVGEAVARIYDVAPVSGIAPVLRCFGVALAYRLSEAPDAPVVVCVFERARDCAVAPALVSYVAELVVVLNSPATSRALLRMLVVRAVDKSLPQRLGIGIPAHEEIGVNTQRVPPHSFACL